MMSVHLSPSPVSSALMCLPGAGSTRDRPRPGARRRTAAAAKGASPSLVRRVEEKEKLLCKSLPRASSSRLVEEFFWRERSMFASSRSSLGFMGKRGASWRLMAGWRPMPDRIRSVAVECCCGLCHVIRM